MTLTTFTSMPDGYRWMTDEEITEYNATTDHRWGWMRDEYIGLVTTCLSPAGQPVVQWDCMIEFGLDHDHDAVECERHVLSMSDNFMPDDRFNEVDEFGQTSWVD